MYINYVLYFSLKRFRLINRDSLDVTMILRARCDDFELYKSPDIQKRGVSVLDLLLKPEEIVPVYVLFSPSTTKPVHSKVVMKSEQSDRKYTVSRLTLCIPGNSFSRQQFEIFCLVSLKIGFDISLELSL